MSRFQADTFVNLQGAITAETAKAILFLVESVRGIGVEPEYQKSIWIPISQVKQIVRHAPGKDEKDSLVVKEWIWNAKVEDTWQGKSPETMGAQESISEEDLDDYDNIVDLEEGPPF